MIRELLFALALSAFSAAHAADATVVSERAADWAEAQARESLALGAELTPAQAAIARQVGVANPMKVRLHVVETLPSPDDPMLVAAAGKIGLMPQAADGMTLGYAVLVKRGAEHDRQLLRHELRHVAQYESRGGIRPFFAEHIPALLRFGYADSPFERDARAHERPAGR
jgi:hypothetical protein